jgi:hypothetical protein
MLSISAISLCVLTAAIAMAEERPGGLESIHGQSNMNRAPIVHRALVREIFVLHHLPDVIGDVGGVS